MNRLAIVVFAIGCCTVSVAQTKWRDKPIKNIRLKEVTVKAKKIRQRGDTLIYQVATFAKDGDRSIGDVLKKMPGI